MAKRRLRKGLSAPGLLREVRACFEELDDPVRGRGFAWPSACGVAARPVWWGCSSVASWSDTYSDTLQGATPAERSGTVKTRLEGGRAGVSRVKCLFFWKGIGRKCLIQKVG